ncbi:MAG: gliding motility lipoprotein GldD [Salinivirgaceae bacterium]|jgi:gliding motility-associated lipoprotein GldD|nr:gliding motility lipoprotein GldD [Salinivirgaceae bacterium]
MIRLFLFIIPVLVFFSCGQDYTPKPRGFFRIDLPEKEYKKSPDILPYRFEVPTNSLIINNRKAAHELYWINIVYPQYKATIHLSYKEVDNNVDQYIKDSRGFVYKHTIKADAISEDVFIKKEKNVYGIKYNIKGDAASNTQFFLTDSTKNFVRGALYFNVTPNKDSLAPVLAYINEDIMHLIETFEWK